VVSRINNNNKEVKPFLTEKYSTVIDRCVWGFVEVSTENCRWP